MTNSTGIQIPKGYLPNVENIDRGQLMVFLIDGANKDLAREYIDTIKKEAAGDIVAIHLPRQPLPLEAELAIIRDYRAWCKEADVIAVLTYTYRPRFTKMIEQADVAFLIKDSVGSAEAGVTIESVKRRGCDHTGKADSSTNHTYYSRPHTPPPKREQRENVIGINITGPAHIGCTTVAAIIKKALEDAFPDKTINVFNTDGDFKLAADRVAAGNLRIAATRFDIIDCQGRVPKKE